MVNKTEMSHFSAPSQHFAARKRRIPGILHKTATTTPVRDAVAGIYQAWSKQNGKAALREQHAKEQGLMRKTRI
jgi:hypothetical protein